MLAAPREPSEADRINPPDVTRILEAVRNSFDYVIVDTPPALAETVLAAFDLSDMLYVMCTLDLPSVRNMSVFLGTLERLKVPTDNVRLVLNKAESDVGIDIEQVTKLFPQGFESVLPYAKEVSRSINLGMPVMAASPTAEISSLMAGGMKLVLPADVQQRVDADTTPKKTGLFRRQGQGLASRPGGHDEAVREARRPRGRRDAERPPKPLPRRRRRPACRSAPGRPAGPHPPARGTPPRRRCASWCSTRWPRACRASRPRSSPSR